MSFELQQNIRNNASELREYVSELYEWEQEMQIKEKAKQKLRSRQQPQKQAQFEARRREEEEKIKEQEEKQRKQMMEKKKNLIRDKNTVQGYYKAWDQFNVDDELKRLEDQEQRAYRPYNPYEDSKNYQRAKPKTKMVVKGTRNVANTVKDPTSLKDKGNLHFKVCEYERAINCYSQCLEKIQQTQADPNSPPNRKLKAIVLSNRAMSYIKINERAKALVDCNLSIQNDDKYMKTYLRRADCFKKLGRYQQSLNDYKKVKQLAPNQPEADIEIKKIQAFLKKRVKETQQKMIVGAIPEMIPGGYRLDIEEVDTLDEEEPTKQENPIQESQNYLEQL